jgi:hypothetical protein
LNDDINEFKTERLQVAVFLHATQLLKLKGLQTSRPGKAFFVFADPDRRADEHELNFNRGAHVAATSLFASQTYLRRLLTQQTEKTITPGDSNDRHHSSIGR